MVKAIGLGVGKRGSWEGGGKNDLHVFSLDDGWMAVAKIYIKNTGKRQCFEGKKRMNLVLYIPS